MMFFMNTMSRHAIWLVVAITLGAVLLLGPLLTAGGLWNIGQNLAVAYTDRVIT